MRRIVMASAVLAMCSPGFGVNMLQNGDMTSPAGTGPCWTTLPPCGGCPGWSQGAPDNWNLVSVANLNLGRNGTVFLPPCSNLPPCPNGGTCDGYWASSDITHNNVEGYVYQTTVGTTTAGEYFVLKGKWGGNVNLANYNLTMSIEVGEGTDPANLTNVKKLTAPTITSSTGINDLVAFSVPPLQATGTVQLTVVWRLKGQRTGPAGDAIIAFRLDDVSLDVATCLNPISVDSIANTALDMDASAPRGSAATVTITGSNFANPPGLDVSLEQSATIIGPVTATVNSSTQLTAAIPIPADAPPGRYDLRVALKGDLPPNQVNCDPVVVSNAFLVYIPAMTNLSFEDPVAAGSGCPPATPLQGVPTDWSAFASTYWKWGNRMNRDSFVDDDGLLVFAPGCPIPNGLHYATIASLSPDFIDETAYVWQTIDVTPGSTYAVLADVAGSGNSTATLELLDGDVDSTTVLGTTTVRDGGADPWNRTAVQGTATTRNKMTVLFRIVEHQENVEHSLHIDNVSIAPCTAPISVTSVSPTAVKADGVKHLTIGGSGFSGGPVPTVLLKRSGSSDITATNVVLTAGTPDTELTCDVDLAGAPGGSWSIMVIRGACAGFSSANSVYLVVGKDFENGEFELPDAPQNCGPPPSPVGGVPQGWSVDLPVGAMLRDSDQWVVTCPCPYSAGGHYATLTSGAAGSMVAYQTVVVEPGQNYRFAGYFNLPDDVIAASYIRLYDGTYDTGILLNETSILGPMTDWTLFEVQATAASEMMTVIWAVDALDVTGTCHADGLSFGIPCAGTPPTITPPLAPNSGNQGQILDNVAINGSDFVVGNTTVQLTKAGQPTITASDVQVAVGGASLTCDLDLTGAADGAWNVVVTTNPGCTATLLGGFTVNIPPPCNTPPQDTDGDHDVDLTDFGVFQTCFNGPNRSYGGPGTIADKCKCLDVDPDDLDVDLTDFGKFQSCFNGPNRPAQGSCT